MVEILNLDHAKGFIPLYIYKPREIHVEGERSNPPKKKKEKKNRAKLRLEVATKLYNLFVYY